LRAVVENKPGVLARVAGQMGRRHTNIDYFTARNLPGKERTVITIGFEADEHAADRMAKSIARLINVLEVTCRLGEPLEEADAAPSGDGCDCR
jgi:acetolactate synthase-1/3 small subunit